MHMHMYIYIRTHIYIYIQTHTHIEDDKTVKHILMHTYGVDTISRLFKMMGFYCRI